MRNYLLDPELTLDTELDWRVLRAQYLSNITLVDDMVGMIVDSLEKTLANSRHVVLPATGHGPSLPGCTGRLIAEFIESGDPSAVDAECASGFEFPPFAVAAP